ncbi:MAG: hypothetical protein AB1546_14840 [bacterium]
MKKEKICYLCGKPDANTRDHVVPRCLFPKKTLPNNLITLKVHKKCNIDISKEEEYFRNLVVSLSQDRLVPFEIWYTKVKRSLQGGEGLRKKLLSSLIPQIDIYSKGGIYLETAPGIKIDKDAIKTVTEKIVRGLYFYHHCPTMLPIRCCF